MIADMRKAEDDLLDEEMEMLREMEDDGNGDGQARNTVGSAVASSHVLVEDSQQVDAGDLKLLGPDGSGSVSDDDDDGPVPLGRDGKPLRVWKKKGMKRQTRRVNSELSFHSPHCYGTIVYPANAVKCVPPLDPSLQSFKHYRNHMMQMRMKPTH